MSDNVRPALVLGKRRVIGHQVPSEQALPTAKRVRAEPDDAYTALSLSTVPRLPTYRDMGVQTDALPTMPRVIHQHLRSTTAIQVLFSAEGRAVHHLASSANQPADSHIRTDPRLRQGYLHPRVDTYFEALRFDETATQTTAGAPRHDLSDLPEAAPPATELDSVQLPLNGLAAIQFSPPQRQATTTRHDSSPTTLLPDSVNETPDRAHLGAPQDLALTTNVAFGASTRPNFTISTLPPPCGLTLALVDLLRSAPPSPIPAQDAISELQAAIIAELGLSNINQFHDGLSGNMSIVLDRLLERHSFLDLDMRLRLSIAWGLVKTVRAAHASSHQTLSAIAILDSLRAFFCIATPPPPTENAGDVNGIVALVYVVVHIATLDHLTLEQCAESLSVARPLQVTTITRVQRSDLAQLLTKPPSITYQRVSEMLSIVCNAVRNDRKLALRYAELRASPHTLHICLAVDEVVTRLQNAVDNADMFNQIGSVWVALRTTLIEGHPTASGITTQSAPDYSPKSFVPPLASSEHAMSGFNAPLEFTYILIQRFWRAYDIPARAREWYTSAGTGPVEMLLHVVVDMATSNKVLSLTRNHERPSTTSSKSSKVKSVDASLFASRQATNASRLSTRPRLLTSSPVHGRGSSTKRTSSPRNIISSPTELPIDFWSFSRISPSQRQSIVRRWVSSITTAGRRAALHNVMNNCSDALVLADPVQLIMKTPFSKGIKAALQTQWLQWLQSGGGKNAHSQCQRDRVEEDLKRDHVQAVSTSYEDDDEDESEMLKPRLLKSKKVQAARVVQEDEEDDGIPIPFTSRKVKGGWVVEEDEYDDPASTLPISRDVEVVMPTVNTTSSIASTFHDSDMDISDFEGEDEEVKHTSGLAVPGRSSDSDANETLVKTLIRADSPLTPVSSP